MRIGELAALVGVSTRTVRHYHALGLMPEPPRRANGYRRYELRDAVRLARVRRLAGLGLSLDEIAGVLSDDDGRDLREVLQELDADLARQQQEVRDQRERLAVLLARAELTPDCVVPPEVATVLEAVPPAGHSPLARLDRELLTLVAAGTGAEDRAGLAALFRELTEPAARDRGQALYARMERLADADPDDPLVAARVNRLAADLAAHLPAELRRTLASAAAGEPADGSGRRWLDAVTELLSPAQADVVRLLFARLLEGAA